MRLTCLSKASIASSRKYITQADYRRGIAADFFTGHAYMLWENKTDTVFLNSKRVSLVFDEIV